MIASDSKNYWQSVRAYEYSYHEHLALAFEEYTHASSCPFASFHFRSFTLPGSRRDIVVTNENRASVDHDRASQVARDLLKSYVRTCGPARTLNSLLINRSDLTGMKITVTQDSYLVAREDENRTLKVELPASLLEGREWPFQRIRDACGKEEIARIWPYDQLERISTRCLLHLSRENVFEHICTHLIDQPWDGVGPADLERLRQWIAAIIGLAPFLAIFGDSFEVLLVQHPAAHHLQTATGIQKSMRSAITWIGRPILPASDNLVKIVKDDSWGVPPDLDGAGYHLSVAASEGRAQELHLPTDTLPLTQLPDLCRVLHVAQMLAGAREEKAPLSFILLCGLETEVLRQHVDGREGDAWHLRTVLEIGDLHAEAGAEEDTAWRDIKKNAGLLQVPGRALFFGPTDCYPDAVVDFMPFEPGKELDTLRRYAMGGGVAALVNEQGVTVFGERGLLCVARGNPLRWSAEQLHAVTEDSLETKLEGLLAAAALDDLARLRIRKACATALRVRERGHGCLIFLKVVNPNRPGADSVAARPMADLWIYRSQFPKKIEDVDDDAFLAALAGMDGEMSVDLQSGRYAARLEHVVPPQQMFSVHLLEEAGLGLSADFLQYQQGMEAANAKLRERAAIEMLGTRHMKALRITRAYPETVLALTVSSDGPLRVWHKGYAVEEWS